MGDIIRWTRERGAKHVSCPAAPHDVRIPEAPKKIDYSKSEAVVPITKVDVKRLAENKVAIYVDGEGNVISADLMGDGGKWWPMPRLGTSKLRDESIYTKTSIGHPAKMSPLWAQRMIQEYTKPGETIFDPMAGIGTTGMEASRLGRNAVVMDIESKWVNQMKWNVGRLRDSGQMRGSVRVLKGDARDIDTSEKGDAIMFSPPYGHGGLSSGVSTIEGVRSNYVDYAPKGADNVGLTSGEEYLDQMKRVYGKCRDKLKPDGVLVVNIKDRVEDGRLVPTTSETRSLVESAGFRLVADRKVYAKPSVTRTIHETRNPDMPHIRHETFLVFKKRGD